MGKVKKNYIKTKPQNITKQINKSSPRQTLSVKEKIGTVSSNNTGKNILLNKTIAPKKIKSKIEICRQKHKNLLNKLTLLKKHQKEERARKNREKTAVIGDLKPLKDALPSLDDIFKLSKEKNQLKTGVREFDAKADEKLSSKQKIKKKREQFIKQVKSFQSILKDPEFRKNPREAIRYHIQYTHGLLEE